MGGNGEAAVLCATLGFRRRVPCAESSALRFSLSATHLLQQLRLAEGRKACIRGVAN